MSDIIDRMARAAYEAQRRRIIAESSWVTLPTWDDSPEKLREECRQFMRDGLAAAREPEDEKVIDAGWVAA